MLWAVDACVLSPLANALRHKSAWFPGVFHTTEGVAAELRRGNPLTPSVALLDCEVDGQPVVRVHILPFESTAAAFLRDELRPNDDTALLNYGEDELIAWCLLVEPDAVFVTVDKKAAMVGLAELGRHRVAHVHDLLHDLELRGVLTSADRALAERKMATSAGIGPRPRRLR